MARNSAPAELPVCSLSTSLHDLTWCWQQTVKRTQTLQTQHCTPPQVMRAQDANGRTSLLWKSVRQV